MTTSERIYALEPGDFGKLNIRTIAKFRAVGVVWQSHAFGLQFDGGKVPTVEDILQSQSSLRPDGLLKESTGGGNSFPSNLQSTIQDIIAKTLEQEMKDLLPQIQSTITEVIQHSLGNNIHIPRGQTSASS